MLKERCFWWKKDKKNSRCLAGIFLSISKDYLDFFVLDFAEEAFFVLQDFEAHLEDVFEDDFFAQEDLLQHLESCSTAIDQNCSS
jgi:hypothetical protein